MRTLWITFAGLLAALTVFVGAVQAQVAAPRLNTTIAASQSVFNPAVLPWSGASRIGGGVFDSATESGTPLTETATGDGFMGQIRLVGENFAFHADMTTQTMKSTQAGGGSSDTDSSLAAFAYQGGGIFSIGVALQQSSNVSTTSTIESSIPIAGISLRVGEKFFVGAAFGTESTDYGDPEFERPVFRAGVGLMSRGGDFAWHLEAYIENRDSDTDLTVPGTSITPKEETSGVTVEAVIFGGLLLGFESVSTDYSIPSGLFSGKNDKTTISVGWAPTEGLNIAVFLQETENTFNVLSLQIKNNSELISVGVSYLY